jgi:hypothetical protein
MTDSEARRFVMAIFYEGPWERLAGWLLKIDGCTLELRGEVTPGSLRERLSTVCETRDRAWRMHYVRRRTDPPARWKRRLPPNAVAPRGAMSVGVLLRSVFSALFVGFAVYFVSRALGAPHIRLRRWLERWLDQ